LERAEERGPERVAYSGSTAAQDEWRARASWGHWSPRNEAEADRIAVQVQGPRSRRHDPAFAPRWAAPQFHVDPATVFLHPSVLGTRETKEGGPPESVLGPGVLGTRETKKGGPPRRPGDTGEAKRRRSARSVLAPGPRCPGDARDEETAAASRSSQRTGAAAPDSMRKAGRAQRSRASERIGLPLTLDGARSGSTRPRLAVPGPTKHPANLRLTRGRWRGAQGCAPRTRVIRRRRGAPPFSQLSPGTSAGREPRPGGGTGARVARDRGPFGSRPG
jgi:hypothetical protein